jgi:hypothetical protein
MSLAFRHFLLYFHGTTSGINCADKFNECGISRCIDDAAAMFFGLQIDEFAADF